MNIYLHQNINSLMKKVLVFSFCTLFVLLNAIAQDSLIMFNGKHYKGNVVGFNNNTTVFKLEYQKKNKIKFKVLPKEDVFAIYYKDSVSQILYTPLITDEQPLSLEEMKSFVAGENLAQYKYHAPWAAAVGAVTGAGMFNLGMWGVTIPAAYVGVVAAVPTKPKSKKYFPPEKLNDQYYVDGFKYVAKRKKLKSAAIGSAASLLVCGTIAAIFTFKYYND